MDLGSVSEEIDHLVKAYMLALYTGQQASSNKLQAPAGKLQASSLTAAVGFDRMNLERNKYGHNTIKKNSGCNRRDFASC